MSRRAPKTTEQASRAHQRKQRAKLRRAIREECHRQIDAFMDLADPESGEVMLDVLIGMLAHGAQPCVSIEMRTPEAARKPLVEVARA